MSNFESWTIKRQISPESPRPGSSNLDKMQENLIIAAHTIDALKQERDRLKQSMKFTTDYSENPYSQSSEIENLQNQLNFKEQIIIKLEKQLTKVKINKADLISMHENLAKLRAELTDKEKHIIGLEKTIRELKADLHSYVTPNILQEPKKSSEKIVEELQNQLFELKNEKNYWKKIQSVLQGAIFEYCKNRELRDKGKNEWETMAEVVFYMRKQLDANGGLFGPQGVSEKEKLVKLEETNRKLMTEIQILKSKEDKPAMLYELNETCNTFLNKLRQKPQFYIGFQTHLTSIAGFKHIIEKKKYSECLLGFLKFVIDLMDNGEFLIKNRINLEIPSESDRKFSQPPQTRQENFEHFAEKPRFFSPSNKNWRQTDWTQTEEAKVINGSRSNKGLQTNWSQEKFSVPRPAKEPEKATKRIQAFEERPIKRDSYEQEKKPPSIQRKPLESHPDPSELPNPSSNFQRVPSKPDLKTVETLTEKGQNPSYPIENQEKGQNYIKLFDESGKLLTIIDKQNTRLAKINSQISQLVPNKLESLDESSSDSENSKALGSYLLNLPSPHSNLHIGSTFNPRDLTGQETKSEVLNENLKKSKEASEKYIKISVNSPKHELKHQIVYSNVENKKLDNLTDSEEFSRLRKNTENPTEDSRFLHSSLEKSSTDNEAHRFQDRNRPQVFDYGGNPEESQGVSEISYHRPEYINLNSEKFQKFSKPQKKSQEPRHKTPELHSAHSKSRSKKDEHWNSIIDYFSNKEESN